MSNGNILLISCHTFTTEEFVSISWAGVHPIGDTSWMGRVLELEFDLGEG